MKCIPMTFSGRDVHAAIFVMEIDEVLLARMVSGPQMLSRSSKIDCFRLKISGTASTTRSASAQGERSVETDKRARAASASSWLRRSFCTSLFRERSMVAMPRSTASWLMSIITTSKPEVAATCAMPLPICPAPITAMRSIAMKRRRTLRS